MPTARGGWSRRSPPTSGSTAVPPGPCPPGGRGGAGAAGSSTRAASAAGAMPAWRLHGLVAPVKPYDTDPQEAPSKDMLTRLRAHREEFDNGTFCWSEPVPWVQEAASEIEGLREILRAFSYHHTRRFGHATVTELHRCRVTDGRPAGRSTACAERQLGADSRGPMSCRCGKSCGRVNPGRPEMRPLFKEELLCTTKPSARSCSTTTVG